MSKSFEEKEEKHTKILLKYMYSLLKKILYLSCWEGDKIRLLILCILLLVKKIKMVVKGLALQNNFFLYRLSTFMMDSDRHKVLTYKL